MMINKIVMYIALAVSALLFSGIINKIKSIWAGRKGAPVLQPYFEFFKLLHKGEVISGTTSFIFKITPSINIGAVLFTLLIVPVPCAGSLISFKGDFVLFAYILGLSRFMTVISALDTGSSFEGMGASREVTFAAIVEPAFFIIIGTLALLTNQISFSSIFAALNTSIGYTLLVKLLLFTSLFIMLLTESSRIPVDDPNTHLELTMIHEVMILDYSGPDLAFILYASALKMLLFSLLIANLFVPVYLTLLQGILFLGLILSIVSYSVGIVESIIARSRMSHLPQFIFLITAFSLTAFAVVAFFLRGGIK